MEPPIEDHIETLERMRELGQRCLDTARARGDAEGLIRWQACLDTVEAGLIRQRTEDPSAEG